MGKREVFVIAAAAALLLALPLAATITNNSSGYLFFTPKKNAVVSGDRLAANGTSAPSNSTRTKCTVEFRANSAGYQRAIPMGKGLDNFTVWKSNALALHPGVNTLEGRFQCFSPALPSFPSLPIFTHFLSHNVTRA